MQTVLSSDPVARYYPVFEKATLKTIKYKRILHILLIPDLGCILVNECKIFLDLTYIKLTFLSSNPVARYYPSYEKAILKAT